MVRFLFPRALLVLAVGLGALGQEASKGHESSFSGLTPDSPPPAGLSCSFQSNPSAAPGSGDDDLAGANRHLLRGELAAAIESYNTALQENPKSPEAYAGLARAYLGRKEVEQAYETILSGLKAADAPAIHVALGEVYYRQGKLAEAEQEWTGVIDKGVPDARAYLGLSEARAARSLYGQAKELRDKARELDPQDPVITNRWVRSLSRTKQIQFWKNYLAAPSAGDDETRAAIKRRLDYLQAVENLPHHNCRLVSHVAATEMKLVKFSRHANQRGLAISLNGKEGTVALDTGADGILIGEEWARQAGIKAISETAIVGLGDEASIGGGHVGFADSVTIGEIEFQGCPVRVDESGSLPGAGIMGTNLFRSYLVELDFPSQKLRLRPLPQRPQEDARDATPEATQELGENEDQSSAERGPEADAKPSRSVRRGPRDRYIAPEMQGYTEVYRFRHLLLVPTRIGDSAAVLFALDTGGAPILLDIRSSPNLLSLVPPAPSIRVRTGHISGLSGSVAAYKVNKVTLQFGRLPPENQNVIDCDLSRLSNSVGTEISGILGLEILERFKILIDYRDGLVDFVKTP